MKQIALFFLLAVGVAVFFYAKKRHTNEEKLITATVQQGNLEIKVETTGTILPKQSIQIKSQVGGRVRAILVALGEKVAVGDLLVEIDPQEITAQVEEQRANLKAAEAELTKAKLSLELSRKRDESEVARAEDLLHKAELMYEEQLKIFQRQKELLARQLVAQQEVDTAETNLKIAEKEVHVQKSLLAQAKENARRNIKIHQSEIDLSKARVTGAGASLKAAEDKLKDTRIFSPIEGIITEVGVEEGDTVAAESFGRESGTVLLTVSDVSEMIAKAEVDEVDMSKLKIGQRAIITLDPFPGKRWLGRITEIGLQAIQGQKIAKDEVSTFSVKVTLSRSDPLLKPGMSCNIDILIKRINNVLILPLEYIELKDGQKIVHLQTGDQIVDRKVVTGERNARYTVIRKGLKAGDTVVLQLKTEEKETTSKKKGKRRRR